MADVGIQGVGPLYIAAKSLLIVSCHCYYSQPQPLAQGKQPRAQDYSAGVQHPGALQRREQPDQHGATEQNGRIDLPA